MDKKTAPSNVLAEHKAKSNHAMDWMNMSIIEKKWNWKSCFYLESLEIQSTPYMLN